MSSTATEAAMGTVVSIEVVRDGADEAIARALGWFHEVEACCSRFDETSELRQLSRQVGVAAQVSAMLYEAVRFSVMVAEESGGAFDPTVRQGDVSYKDVEIDPVRRTIRLRRPLTLDLGAVAKGMAVDLAARELQGFDGFAIDAGGDLYLGGLNRRGEAWAVGIRHPRREAELMETLYVSNQAVCTSGDYERGDHILDPRKGTPAGEVASVTVVAGSAMLADALGTAAFVLGPKQGLEFLSRMGVAGLIVTTDLQRHETGGLRRAA